MTYDPIIIVDSGILVAYYSARDRYHQQVRVGASQLRKSTITLYPTQM